LIVRECCFEGMKKAMMMMVDMLIKEREREYEQVIMIESVWCSESGSLRKNEDCLLLLRLLLKIKKGES